MTATDFDLSVGAISALRDPIRRNLYRYVVQQPGAVGRDEASGALGIARSVAAFHLDRLVSEGVLEVEFRRLGTRRGPGAGRPSKLYRRAAREIAVSLPPRGYMLIAELLARAVSVASLGTRPVSEVVRDVAEDAGRAIGERVVSHLPTGASREQRIDALFEVLVGEGFEPRLLDSHIALANCPFHVLAGEFTELVCGMNHQVLDGLVRAIGDDFADSRLEPESGFCCVRIYLRETT